MPGSRPGGKKNLSTQSLLLPQSVEMPEARPILHVVGPVPVDTVERGPVAAAASKPLLGHVLVLAVLVSLGILFVVLVPLGGWHYYSEPLETRGYQPQHSLLRPSGQVGRALGIAGTACMVVMHLYSLRKRTRVLGTLGRVPGWLEFHIFCGILGPLLITLHTSFKFNGIVAVAYWSMVMVMVSGFVGRYLYVRIPKSLRGQELTHAEVCTRADELKRRLLDSTLPVLFLRRVETFEASVIPAAESATTWTGLVLGEVTLRRRLRILRNELHDAGVSKRILHEAADTIAERAVLLLRIAYLKKTKQLFDLWHVFHRPLAVIVLLIVTVHIATALYFGYAFGKG